MATAGALEDQELMSEGKNLSFERCSSLKACRAEENSERMIVSMSPKSYSDGRLNSTSSVRTEFLVGTGSEISATAPYLSRESPGRTRPQRKEGQEQALLAPHGFGDTSA